MERAKGVRGQLLGQVRASPQWVWSRQLAGVAPASWQMMAYPLRTWQRSSSCSLGSRAAHRSDTQCLGGWQGQVGGCERGGGRPGGPDLQKRPWKPHRKGGRRAVGMCVRVCVRVTRYYGQNCAQQTASQRTGRGAGYRVSGPRLTPGRARGPQSGDRQRRAPRGPPAPHTPGCG